MELRADKGTTDPEGGRPCSTKWTFVEPELVKQGTLPKLTWYDFS